MKVLIVCSGNYPEPEANFHRYQAFIYDQIEALRIHGVFFEKYLIVGKGVIGYLSNILRLKKKIKFGKYDIVHAHFSLSGLISVLSSSVPVIITFHGSDINNGVINIISSISTLFAKGGIYVSHTLYNKAFIKAGRHSIIPCGINFEIFQPEEMNENRKKESLDPQKKYVLFSSHFENPIKNFALAKNAVNMVNDGIELLELKNRSRFEVRRIINSVDVLLLTSFSEGSPQIIKEAMACNCPIVATDVGDIKEVIGNTQGCYITTFDPKDVAEKIVMALAFGRRTKGREKIKRFDNKLVATQVYDFYIEVLARRKKK